MPVAEETLLIFFLIGGLILDFIPPIKNNQKNNNNNIIFQIFWEKNWKKIRNLKKADLSKKITNKNESKIKWDSSLSFNKKFFLK